MVRPPPITTRTDTLLPYTTLFRSRFSGKPKNLPVENVVADRRDLGLAPAGANALGVEEQRLGRRILAPVVSHRDLRDRHRGAIRLAVGVDRRDLAAADERELVTLRHQDRKSTRLNSSH